jgi:hypothetical protein
MTTDTTVKPGQVYESRTRAAASDGIAPPADSVALSAFRALPDGSGRQYTAATFPAGPWKGCERMIRMAWYIGFLKPSCATQCSHYAVLDVLNAEDDIVRDYCIPHGEAFRWWYSKLHLRVEDAAS